MATSENPLFRPEWSHFLNEFGFPPQEFKGFRRIPYQIDFFAAGDESAIIVFF